jgi:predicted TPR repeat methyltransferase
VEHLEDGDYKLLPSSRYAQGEAYIEKLAAENMFEIMCLEPVVVRVEKEVPIAGRIFVLRAVP